MRILKKTREKKSIILPELKVKLLLAIPFVILEKKLPKDSYFALV